MAVDLTKIDGTIDIYCIDDFLPNMPTVKGHEALCQRLIRRITTRRGQLPFWPDDGYDVRDALLSKKRPHDIAAAVAAECRKDEQIQGGGSINVSAELSSDGKTLTLAFEAVAGETPFTFTLLVDDAAVSLVSLQKTA